MKINNENHISFSLSPSSFCFFSLSNNSIIIWMDLKREVMFVYVCVREGPLSFCCSREHNLKANYYYAIITHM